MKTTAAADADRAAAKRSAAVVAMSACPAEEEVDIDAQTLAWQQDGSSSRPSQRARSGAAGNEWATSSFLALSLPASLAPASIDQAGQSLHGRDATVAYAATDVGGLMLEPLGHPSPADPREEDTACRHPALKPHGLTSASCAYARRMRAPALALDGTAESFFQRTADGLNVVRLRRQAVQADSEVTSGAGSSRSQKRGEGVNSGWGNNFVRIDLKVPCGAGHML